MSQFRQGKFVSVFIEEVVGLSPSATSSLLAATPFALAVSSLIAQVVSSWMGAYHKTLPRNHGCDSITQFCPRLAASAMCKHARCAALAVQFERL